MPRYLRTLKLTFVLSLLTKSAFAQLVGCDAVNCPAAGCVVGNASNSDLGITSFSSKISPDGPFTWAVGISGADLSNSTDDVFVKSYYLGTPPTLGLNKTTTFSGCALFFEGISKNLALNGTTQYDSVACDEVLQAGCVDDLLAQAAQQIQNLTSSTSATNSSLCQALQSALQAAPPSSCPPAVGGSWGTIVPKEITGPEAPAPLTLSSCHPSTGGNDYAIALVETQSMIAFPEFVDPLVGFLYGITPVLTVFYNGEGQSALTKPETHLSCMKIVAATGSSTGAKTGGAPGLRTPPQQAIGMSSTIWVAVLALASAAFLA